MPIPNPKSGETQEEFTARCHSALADEFTDEKQRHAICMDSWREQKTIKDRRDIIQQVNKTLKSLDKMITGLEKEIINKHIVDEINKQYLSIFNDEGKRLFKEIYIDTRLSGAEKEEALNIANRLVAKEYYNKKVVILKGIENLMKRIVSKIKNG